MNKECVIVSGLPRSGTSMIMRMLEAGGIPPFTDVVRKADADNPRGYYEYEAVKRLDKDASWMGETAGHALKVISSLLRYLPQEYAYAVLFVNRSLEEVLASQQAMLQRRAKEGRVPPETVAPERLKAEHDALLQSYTRHLRQTRLWLEEQPNIRSLVVEHRKTLHTPQQIAQTINQFLGGTLDIAAMTDTVEQQLYRHRI